MFNCGFKMPNEKPVNIQYIHRVYLRIMLYRADNLWSKSLHG